VSEQTPESQTQEITHEELAKLVNEVVSQPDKYPSEAKLILTLEVWQRQGAAYDDYAKIDVIDGEVDEVELDYRCESYPYPCYKKIALIPRTVPTIVKWYSYTNTTDPPTELLKVYVFTGKEWKRVDVY
jgi:hypothetical protein